jgi:hypothetical protein
MARHWRSGQVLTRSSGHDRDPPKNNNEINTLQGEKLRPTIAKKPIRMTFGGITVVRDEKWPSMYRLRMPDGHLSDMVNLTRARDAAQVLAGLAK